MRSAPVSNKIPSAVTTFLVQRAIETLSSGRNTNIGEQNRTLLNGGDAKTNPLRPPDLCIRSIRNAGSVHVHLHKRSVGP
jgi:hypothetical protein